MVETILQLIKTCSAFCGQIAPFHEANGEPLHIPEGAGDEVRGVFGCRSGTVAGVSRTKHLFVAALC